MLWKIILDLERKMGPELFNVLRIGVFNTSDAALERSISAANVL
jgi:hypothetical protein